MRRAWRASISGSERHRGEASDGEVEFGQPALGQMPGCGQAGEGQCPLHKPATVERDGITDWLCECWHACFRRYPATTTKVAFRH